MMSRLYSASSPGYHHCAVVLRGFAKEGTRQASMSTVRGRLVLEDQVLGRCFAESKSGWECEAMKFLIHK